MVSNPTISLEQSLQAARTAFAQGQFNESLALLNNALEQAHRDNAPESVVAEIFFELGLCHQNVNDLGNAKRRFKQSLGACERAFGLDSPHTRHVQKYLDGLPEGSASNIAQPEVPPLRESIDGPVAQAQTVVPNAEYSSAAPGTKLSQAKPEHQDGTVIGRTLSIGHSDLARTSDYGAKVPQAADDDQPVNVDQLVHPRERFYGTLSTIISCMIYGVLILTIIGIFVAPLVYLVQYLISCIFHGQLRSNGIRISEQQFPEVYEAAEQVCARMGMSVPQLFVIQEHGLLNAYAKRAHHKDIVVIYSSVFEMAYERGLEELKFILAHELTHVKRGHVRLAWLRMPAAFVPFLAHAYSRGCEYTCDRVAAALVPKGALYGLVALASGTHLYKHVNLAALHQQQDNDWDFWTWYAEVLSTHPNLVNRIRAVGLRVLPDQDQWEEGNSRVQRWTKHSAAVFLIVLCTALCLGQSPAQAKYLGGGHHRFVRRAPAPEAAKEQNSEEDAATTAEDQSQSDQSMQSEQSENNGERGTVESAESEAMARQLSGAGKSAAYGTIAIVEILFIGLLVLNTAGGGVLGGLLICAIVYHVGKLFRGGRKPVIG